MPAMYSPLLNPVVQALNISDGNVSWNAELGNIGTLALTENATLVNPTNLRTGYMYALRVTQDATGNRSISVGTDYERVPAIYASANSVTLLMFFYDGTKLCIFREAPQIREISFFGRSAGISPGTVITQYPNLPAARTEYGTFTRNLLDLRPYNECQLFAHITTSAPTSGGKFAVMGSIDNWATPIYLDGSPAATPIGSEQPQVDVSVASTQVRSNWIKLSDTLKTLSTSVALFVSSGTGAQSPSFNAAVLRLR